MNEPLRNTLAVVAQVEIATVPLATLVALALERTDVPLRRVIWGLCVTLLFLPLYAQAAAWNAGFGQQGWWAYRSESGGQAWLAGERAVVWIHACAALPWATVLIGGSLRHLSASWEEWARLETSPWQVILRVTLPRAWPGIVAAVLWIAVSVSGEMIVTDMYQVRTYAEAIFLDLAAGASLSELTWGATGNVAAVGCLVGAAAWLAYTTSSPREASASSARQFWPLGAWRWPASLACLTLFLFLWAVPLASLAYHAGTEITSRDGRRVREWSAAGVVRQVAAAPRQFDNELQWSGQIGLLAALVAVSAATPLAWWGRSSRGAVVVGCAVSALGLGMPGPLVSLLLLQLRDASRWDWVVRLFDETILVVVAVHAWRAFPLVWLLLLDALRSFPQDEWEWGAVSGAAPWRRWWMLVWPRRRGAILAAGLLAWSTSLAEVPVSQLVGPEWIMTLSVRTFQLVHYGSDDRLAGLVILTILLTALGAAVAAWLARWGGDERSTTGDV